MTVTVTATVPPVPRVRIASVFSPAAGSASGIDHFVDISGLAYTLSNADDRALLYTPTSMAPVTVIIPPGLSSTLSCQLLRVNGQITVVPSVGVQLTSKNSKFSSLQYELLALLAVGADTYELLGETVDREQPPPIGTNEPVNTVLPSIAQSGFSLIADQGIWITGEVLTEFSFQWYRDAALVDGATGSSYAIVDADVGTRLTVKVTAVNEFGSGSATSLPTDLIAGAAPANTALPTIAGGSSPPKTGETLTLSPGTWTGVPTPVFTYQWKKSGVAIAGATQSAYRIAAGDVGGTISATVTATNSESPGGVSATSAATAAVVAGTGTAPVLSLFSVNPAPQFGEGAADMEVTTNAGDGIFSWVIVNSGAPAPTTAAQIKAGTDGAGNPGVQKGSIEVASIETRGQNPAGLSSGTAYDAYGVIENSVGQASNIVTDAFTMGGSALPTLSTPVASDFADIFVWATVTTDNGNGTLYGVVVPEGSATPSAAQIKLGQNASGAAAPAANQALTTPGTKKLLIRGLTAATAYKICFVQHVPTGDSNVVTAVFKSDTLLKAGMADGTTTGFGPGTGTIYTPAQADPFGGANAVKWSDNNDGVGVGSETVNASVQIGLAATLFDGVAKYHMNFKHESGAEWMRVNPANITHGGILACNVATGEIGAHDWVTAPPPACVSLGGGWFQFSGRCSHSPLTGFTGTPDYVGALNLYMADANGQSFVDGRDGTNVRYLHDIRITRETP